MTVVLAFCLFLNSSPSSSSPAHLLVFASILLTQDYVGCLSAFSPAQKSLVLNSSSEWQWLKVRVGEQFEGRRAVGHSRESHTPGEQELPDGRSHTLILMEQVGVIKYFWNREGTQGT
jgi:hypothetical protein